MILPGISYGLSMMPMLYCVWSHFPKTTGNVTGIVMASFGLSSVVYNMIIIFMINPSNLHATLSYFEGN